MFGHLRYKASDWLFSKSIPKYRTSMFWKQAKTYFNHWEICKKNFAEPLSKSELILNATNQFNQKGFTTLQLAENKHLAKSIYEKIKQKEKSGKRVWLENAPNIENYFQNPLSDFDEIEKLFKGKLGELLRNIFQCNFNIFLMTMQHSKRTHEHASASQLWHNDGGPGTCINVMFYISKASDSVGAIEILPWEKSKDLLIKRRFAIRKGLKNKTEKTDTGKKEIRDLSTNFYRHQIDKDYKEFVERPVGDEGLVVLFSNNNIHKGGFPDEGHERYVCIFHCYPSDAPADFSYYREEGLKPKSNYPKNLKDDLR
jgi:transcriptional regulator with XRE-family HTH domain